MEKGVGRILKEYFGVWPLLGGVFTSGLTSTSVFLISLFYYLSGSCSQILSGNLDYVSLAYKQAGEIAGQWILPSYAAGQFLAYKLKKAVLSLLR